MEIRKEVLLEDVPGLYAVGNVTLRGERYYAAASENRDGEAFLVHEASGKAMQLKGGAGGVMAAIGLAKEDALLFIEEFYPVFDSGTAKVIKVEPDTGDDGKAACRRTVLGEVPYVHRIAHLHEEDGDYIAAGKLCKFKAFPDDWSTSGTMEIGRYTQDRCAVNFEPVFDGIFKHHAMYIKKNQDGYDDLYYGGEEAVFCTTRKSGVWVTKKLLDVPASDIVYEDLDGDGKEELAIIEEFHGNRVSVFKVRDGVFRRELELPLSFGHVLWGGTFLKRPGLIAGSRSGEKTLTLYRFRTTDGHLAVSEETEIDRGQAPAQIVVNETENGADIVAANHGMKQLVRYQCREI